MMQRFLVLAGALVGIANSHEGHNSNSHLTIVRPTALAHAYGDDNVPHQEALFGIPTYGEEIIAKVIYVTAGTENRGCDPYSSAESLNWAKYGDFILLVDRGECNFVKKVRNAEDAGAAGVIVSDNQCLSTDPFGYCDDYSLPTGAVDSNNPGTCANDEAAHGFTCSEGSEALLPFMADDGSGGNIRIPSFFVSQFHGRNIKNSLCSLEDKSACDEDTNNYPLTKSLVVTMSWDIPADDDHVSWELWTSSEDWFGSEFKREFARIAKELDQATDFEPHYFIYDGIHEWGCQAEDGTNDCPELCTNDGRYCALSPEGENFAKLDGTDVVKENLRQICVWKHALKQENMQLWWDYINDFADTCFGEEGVEDTESFEQCSQDVMGKNKIDHADIHKCVNDSGGTEGGRNSYLEEELLERKNLYILTLPSVVVNGALLRQSTTYGPVLTAICQAFLDGTEPQICDEVLDPAGMHEGTLFIDAHFLVEGLTIAEFTWPVQSEFRSQIAFKAGVAKSSVEIMHIAKSKLRDDILELRVILHSLTSVEANRAKNHIQQAADSNDIQFHTAQVQAEGLASVMVIVHLDKTKMTIQKEAGQTVVNEEGSGGTTAGVTFMLVVLVFCMIFLCYAMVIVWRRVGLGVSDLNIFSDFTVSIAHRFEGPSRRSSGRDEPQGALHRPLADGDYTPMSGLGMDHGAAEVQGTAVAVSEAEEGVTL